MTFFVGTLLKMICIHLHPGILFGIIPEHRSESSRNRVHLAPDSPRNGWTALRHPGDVISNAAGGAFVGFIGSFVISLARSTKLLDDERASTTLLLESIIAAQASLIAELEATAIPAQRPDAVGRVGQDDARAFDAQLRRGQGVPQRLWN